MNVVMMMMIAPNCRTRREKARGKVEEFEGRRRGGVTSCFDSSITLADHKGPLLHYPPSETGCYAFDSDQVPSERTFCHHLARQTSPP